MKNIIVTLFAIFVHLTSFSQCETDTILPYFVDFEHEITVSCDVDLDVIFPVALDNCDDSVEIAWYEEITLGYCESNYDVLRLYRAFDNIGNQAVEMQIIHIVDETSPVFAPLVSTTIECGDTVIFDDPQVTDNCSDFILTSYDIISQLDSCTTNYIRVWEATDFCGNTSNSSQTITSIDVTPPSIMGPLYVEVEQISDIDSFFVNTFDNCTQVTLTYSDTEVSGNSYIRIYTAIDQCGNQTQFEQIVHVNTPPDEEDDENDNRVAICHREGNGSFHTIYVNQNAVDAHLAHGDYLGPCTEIMMDWQTILPNSDLQMQVVKGKDKKFKKFVRVR